MLKNYNIKHIFLKEVIFFNELNIIPLPSFSGLTGESRVSRENGNPVY